MKNDAVFLSQNGLQTLRDSYVREKGWISKLVEHFERLEAAAGLKTQKSATVILGRALIARLSQVIAAFDQGPGEFAAIPEKLWKEIQELHAWLVRAPLDKTTEPQVRNDQLDRGRSQMLGILLHSGNDPNLALDLVNTKKIGRPTERRELFLTAHEDHVLLRRTWREIADSRCDCGKKSHDEYCRNNIRIGVVQQVKPLMRQYQRGV